MEPWAWAIVIVAFLIVEFVTIQIVSVWFAVGSIAGLILSFFPGVDIWVQILVAIAVSLIALIATRPLLKKWMDAKGTKMNLDANIGKEVQIIKPITKSESGTIVLNDITWMAVSEKAIKAETWVRITKVDGNRMHVEAIKNQIDEEVIKEPAVKKVITKAEPIAESKPVVKKTPKSTVKETQKTTKAPAKKPVAKNKK